MQEEKQKNQEELLEQQNKKYRGVREKLRKRWENQKEIHKEKKLKKKEYEKEKENTRNEFFQQKDKKKNKKKDKDEFGINNKKLFKRLKKFLKVYQDKIEDFLDLFNNLDQGEEIDITCLENETIKSYLTKIFKTLKLSKKDYHFKKSKKCKVENLYKYMSLHLNNIVDTIKQNDSSDISDNDDQESANEDSNSDNKKQLSESNESDEDNEEKESEKKSLKRKLNDQIDKDVLQNQQQKQQTQKISNIPQSNMEQKKQILSQQRQPFLGPVGPVGPVGPIRQAKVNSDGEEEDEEIQQKKLQFQKDINNSSKIKENPARQDWMLGDWGSLLDNKFDQKDMKLKQFLDHRQKPQEQQKVVQKKLNIYAEGSAKLDEDDEDLEEKEQKIKDFMKNYNEQFRGKSLLQEHQEMQAEKKRQSKGLPVERVAFDREKDMIGNRVDSKRLFSALKDTEVLKSKFSNSKYEKSFL